MDAIAPGGLGGTYAGSPIACAAALAVMEVFEEEHLLDRCKAVGERLVTGLKAIQAKYPVIGEVRALGAMIAVELFVDGQRCSSRPNSRITRLTSRCWSSLSRIWKVWLSLASCQCARNKRCARPWKVPTDMPAGFIPISCSMR